MKAKREIMKEVRRAIKEPYAWPGGYPLFLIMSDGGALCMKCAKKNEKLIRSSTLSGYKDGWNTWGPDINWEDTNLFCDNCNKLIESAYGR
jgi:hypothetical protein